MTITPAKLALTLVIAGILTGCAREPSLTTTDEWNVVEGATMVSVCYSAQESTRLEVEALALSQCPENQQSLSVIRDDNLLNDCPILKRNRVTFACGIR